MVYIDESTDMKSQYSVKWKKQVIKEYSMISYLFYKTIHIYIYIYIYKNIEDICHITIGNLWMVVIQVIKKTFTPIFIFICNEWVLFL